MKKKNNPKTTPAVAYVKEKFSPKVPCVNADAEGYCTGPCEGSLCFKCASYNPIKPAPVVPEVMQPPAPVTALAVRLGDLAIPDGTPAEMANALHRDFIESAKSAMARAVQCGWVLCRQRQVLGHGRFGDWCAQNLSFGRTTAYNYMNAFENTVGAARAAMRRPLPLDVEPTMAEIEAACCGMAEKPVTALYRDTGMVVHHDNWGGKDRGQGRKPKDADVAAELEKVATLEPALWASSKGALDTLVQLDAERDVFRRLTDDHLATVSGILADLAKKAAEILKQRLSGKITATLDTAEAVSILEKGL